MKNAITLLSCSILALSIIYAARTLARAIHAHAATGRYVLVTQSGRMASVLDTATSTIYASAEFAAEDGHPSGAAYAWTITNHTYRATAIGPCRK